MRQVIQEQMQFGEVAISDIEFDIRSRDEILRNEMREILNMKE